MKFHHDNESCLLYIHPESHLPYNARQFIQTAMDILQELPA